MNIRVHLSEIAGSDEKTIEAIERAVKDRQPFGLKCQRSKIVFIPHQYRAYWIWSDGDLGPAITLDNLKGFIDHIKMQYMSHKELISTDELLGIAQILKHEQQKRQLEAIRPNILPESNDPSGPLDTGN